MISLRNLHVEAAADLRWKWSNAENGFVKMGRRILHS